MGSDHTEGQTRALCPPGNHEVEEVQDGDDNEHEVSCHKYLEQGKHDKMLHPDANVDDGVEPAEGWTEVPLA